MRPESRPRRWARRKEQTHIASSCSQTIGRVILRPTFHKTEAHLCPVVPSRCNLTAPRFVLCNHVTTPNVRETVGQAARNLFTPLTLGPLALGYCVPASKPLLRTPRPLQARHRRNISGRNRGAFPRRRCFTSRPVRRPIGGSLANNTRSASSPLSSVALYQPRWKYQNQQQRIHRRATWRPCHAVQDQ